MKVCIITGASSGLGERLVYHATRLVEADEYWIIARSEKNLRELAESYNGYKLRPFALDLTDKNSIDVIKDTLDSENAELTALINNAGFGKLGNVWELSPSSQQNMIALNCQAPTMLCSICINYMKNGAFILNIGSIAAFSPNARLNCYSATKSFIFAFTQGLRFELRTTGINACVACPGPMNTPFLSNADIEKGSSHTFDTLPYCDPDKVAKNAIRAAKKGRAVYTPTLFYKFYRVLAKLLPVRLTMYFSKV